MMYYDVLCKAFLMSFSLNTDCHSWQSITSVQIAHARNLGMADRKAVTINVGGEQIIQVRPELFNVVGDNHFASMFFQGVGKINWMQRDISLLTIHLGCFCH